MATLALSFPTPSADNSGDPICHSKGIGAFANADNFTLAAYSTSKTNNNFTGSPIVLSSVGDGDLYYLSLKNHSLALSQKTWASSPNNDLSTFSLVNGTIIPLEQNLNITNINTVPTPDGDVVSFTNANITQDSSNSDPVYCGTMEALTPARIVGRNRLNIAGGADIAVFPHLAYNGDDSSFSLCQSNDGGNWDAVVYKARDNVANSSYDFSTCNSVKLRILDLI
ncbi:hypothetical protein C8Q75DRAFT_732455 [Abortiporus biennis]|nr:hypothetical protein C8Q75DRAFT_732455 [Abortiporus biennis]